ncbi:MAG: deoxyhypusine synthase family protein, partial [Desulfobacterales bacterium]|nr:deoxyhypusine synthase family protein [Desulfobacterales bacterium]
ISQILQISYDGADRGLQISTANEKEGSLSGCTFSESVTWGKYRTVDQERLVQIWGEYSIIFPILAAYVIETVEKKPAKKIISQIPGLVEKLENAG